jgi:hypothetical protein
MLNGSTESTARLLEMARITRMQYLNCRSQWPRSKAWSVCALWNTGIVDSNPTRGMDICVSLFCVCVCGQVATLRRDDPLSKKFHRMCIGIGNWSETERFTDALWSKVGAKGRWEREREREYLHFQLIRVTNSCENICVWLHALDSPVFDCFTFSRWNKYLHESSIFWDITLCFSSIFIYSFWSIHWFISCSTALFCCDLTYSSVS